MKIHLKLAWRGVLLLLAACPGRPPDPTDPTDVTPRLTTVTVTCSPTSVVSYSSTQCHAIAADQHGAPFPVPGYTWTSSDESVAKVDARGIASTTHAGTVTLLASATVEGVTKEGQATLTVTEKSPTVHSTPITADETWRASDNPHLVRGQVTVNGGDASATLTLEPGVLVRFDEDAALVVEKGALLAPGTQAQPILLAANQRVPTQGFWRGLKFATSAEDSLLEHVTLSDCGRTDAQGWGTCLDLLNTTLVARDVTVRNSGSRGVSFGYGGGLGAGSARLSVFGSKYHAMTLSADQVGALPLGVTFSGNGTDAIAVFNSVTRSQTWPNLGVPYDLYGPSAGVLGNPSTPTTPTTLTLSAGTVLRFSHDGFEVGSMSNGLPADLVVNGTEEAPVRFTSASRVPRPGDWRGVSLRNITSNTRISHAIIEYAGDTFFNNGGNLNLYGSTFCTDCPTLEHVILQKSSLHGMTLQAGRLAAGSTGVTLRDNAKHAIYASADSVGNLSPGVFMPLSGNAPDAVKVAGTVMHSQTWPNLGIPYDIFGRLTVMGNPSTPNPPATTLTLSAGTVVRFDAQASLNVGDAFGPADLIVNGTEEAPVRFTSASTTPQPGDWGGVTLGNTITSATRISHAIIEYGGRTQYSSTLGNLNLQLSGSTASPTLDHVVLRKGSAYGLVLNGGRLAQGSGNVTIRDNGGYAIRAVANSVGSLPAQMTFGGNSPDAVDVSYGDVTTTQTWPALGVPYILAESLYVGYGSTSPTLTLAAGAELRFPKDSVLTVGQWGAAALVVAGTAQAPVRLVPNTSTPTKGFWGGVHLFNAGNRLDYAFISHGGAGSSSLRGNLNVYQEDGGFVTHSTFSDSSACGLMVSTQAVTTDFTLPQYNNTFLNNTSAPQCAQ